jgi:uncharacterized YigZ family protein
MSDVYNTIKREGKSVFKDRGSKFLGFSFPVESQEEVNDILQVLRKEYHDARHHCYAWKLGQTENQWRANDDGEPSNSAGKPILQQINSRELTNVLVVVIRYFGGILLGVGGLINAYKTAASDALDEAGLIQKFINEKFQIIFDYAHTNEVMKILNDAGVIFLQQSFEGKCDFLVSVRESQSSSLIEKLSFVPNIVIKSQSKISG